MKAQAPPPRADCTIIWPRGEVKEWVGANLFRLFWPGLAGAVQAVSDRCRTAVVQPLPPLGGGGGRAENPSPLCSLAHPPRPAFEDAWSRPLPAEVDSRGVPTLCVLGGIQRNERFCPPRRPVCLFGLCTVRTHRTLRPPDQPPLISPWLDAAHGPRLQQSSPDIRSRVALERLVRRGHDSCNSRRADGADSPDPAAAAADS